MENQGPQSAGQGQTLPGFVDLLNLTGYLQTIDFVPTAIPRLFREQFVIVTAGGSSRAYIYDTVGAAWKYTTLT